MLIIHLSYMINARAAQKFILFCVKVRFGGIHYSYKQSPHPHVISSMVLIRQLEQQLFI